MHLRTTRRRPRLAVTALLAGAVLALSACSGGGAPGGPRAAGDVTITVFNGATGAIAENWNPFSPTLLQPARGVLYESLFYFDLATGEPPVPLLGTGYTWNAAGTQLTITTRDGVQWSDGQPFSARDVAFTFNMVAKTPQFNSAGLAATAQATNDNTVVLTFPNVSYVQEANVLGYITIVPEHVWSKMADPITDINHDPVGTGAFTVESFSPQSYQLKANPTYWGGKPAIAHVRYIGLAGADAASAALLAGQVDWMSAYFPSFRTLMAGQKDLSYVNSPGLTTTLHTCANAGLGCRGAQTDPAVRQAIFYAIDRTQLNNLAFDKFGVMPSVSLLMPERDKKWIADGVGLAPSTADPVKAQSLLEAAGWVKGADGIYAKNGERLVLTVQVVSGYSDFISAIAAMTQQLHAVGIELRSNQVAYNEWNANETNGTFQLSMDSIGLGASTDPYFTYSRRYATNTTAPVGQSASSNNYSRYSNPVVDAAVLAAGQTKDEAVKAQQYAIIQKEIARDMPYIPVIIGSTLTEFNNSRVTGWPTQEDLYAFPASWKDWDNGAVLKRLKPVGR